MYLIIVIINVIFNQDIQLNMQLYDSVIQQLDEHESPFRILIDLSKALIFIQITIPF